jgi:NADPH:quinone reductase-like Zn-dependent oxidoreductase
MRAWNLEKRGELSSLRLVEAVQPEPEDGQVLIRVKGSCVDQADLAALQSSDGGGFLRDGRLSVALGFDFAGVVEEIRSGAVSFRPGDEVFGFVTELARAPQGPFSEFVAVDATSIARKPAALSFAHAACLPKAGSAALQGLRDKAKVESGAAVVINGGGAVGFTAVQIAALLGAEVAAVLSSEGEALLNDAGVTAFNAARRLSDLTGPFAAVFDVAGDVTFNDATGVLTDTGAYVTLTRSALFLAGLAQSAFSGRSAHVVSLQSRGSDLQQLAEWAEAGRLRPVLQGTVGYKALPEAYALLGQGSPGPVAIEL